MYNSSIVISMQIYYAVEAAWHDKYTHNGKYTVAF